MNNEKALNWLYNNHSDFSWDMVDFGLPSSRGIYCIYDTVSGLAYFGSSNNIRTRKSMHCLELKKRCHPNKWLTAAYKKETDLKFFCVKLTSRKDTASMLEAHFANVFGLSRVFNIATVYSIVCRSDNYYGSSEECISVANSLGYPFIWDEHLRLNSARVAFSRAHTTRETENAAAIEAARKLIL